MCDTTQQNFFFGLQDVVSCWRSGTNSGRHYRQQYAYHCGIQRETIRDAWRDRTTVPEYKDIDIVVTRFQRGPGFIPNEASQPAGIADPAALGPPHASLSPPPHAGNESPPPRCSARATLYLN